MDKHKSYVLEKTMYAYGKYVKGEYFEKARAIILKDGKVAFIKDLSNEKITIPGGGVDEGETIEQAVVREAMEETGMNVKTIMPVHKEYYDVDMEIGSIEFTSKRVAYAYLCELISEDNEKHGLEGEYAGKIEIFFDEIDKLERCNISKEAIDRIKQYVELQQIANK